MKKFIVSLSVTMLLVGQLWAKELQQSMTIYGWLPTVKGNFTYSFPDNPDNPDGEEESTDAGILDNFDMFFMGNYGVEADELSFLADFIYLKMSGETAGSLIDSQLDMEFSAKLLNVYGGYNLMDNDASRMDLVGGLRYLNIELDEQLEIFNRTLKASQSLDHYNALIGIKGHYKINKNWYIPYLFDIGTGDSDITYHGQVSIAYRFESVDVALTYKYLYFEKEDALLIDSLELHGPKLGIVYHF